MIFHKNINDKIIAVLGTWDPFLPGHRALFKNLLRRAKKKGLNPYVIIFYPNPANFVKKNSFKDYFDAPARIELFKTLGINSIIVVDIAPTEIALGPSELFDQLFEKTGVTLNELWIGENQSFGSGPAGFYAIRTECARRNIRLRILKNSFLVSINKDDVNRDFRAGRYGRSAEVVGYFPTYKIAEDLQINTYDGVYSAVLRMAPLDKGNEIAVIAKIANEKLEEINRPGGYDWLVLLEKTSIDEPRIF